MKITTNKLEDVKKYEKLMKKLYTTIIEFYNDDFIKENVEYKISYFWIDSGNKIEDVKTDYNSSGTCYINFELMKNGKKIGISGGETDDFGAFHEMISIDMNKQGYIIIVYCDFSKFIDRLNTISYDLHEWGYEYFES